MTVESNGGPRLDMLNVSSLSLSGAEDDQSDQIEQETPAQHGHEAEPDRVVKESPASRGDASHGFSRVGERREVGDHAHPVWHALEWPDDALSWKKHFFSSHSEQNKYQPVMKN